MRSVQNVGARIPRIHTDEQGFIGRENAQDAHNRKEWAGGREKGKAFTRIDAKGPVFARMLRPGTPVFAQMLRPGTREFEKTLTVDIADERG
jgi:hypothetical protein